MTAEQAQEIINKLDQLIGLLEVTNRHWNIPQPVCICVFGAAYCPIHGYRSTYPQVTWTVS
jgi:hypothetical protein